MHNNQHYKVLIIDYVEALDLLYRYIGVSVRQREIGLSHILEKLLLSFLGSYCHDHAKKENELLSTLEYYGFYDFETSEIGSLVSDSILFTTRYFLPGFKAYDPSHCIQKECIRFNQSSNVIFHLTQEQFNVFTTQATGFNDTGFISYI